MQPRLIKAATNNGAKLIRHYLRTRNLETETEETLRPERILPAKTIHVVRYGKHKDERYQEITLQSTLVREYARGKKKKAKKKGKPERGVWKESINALNDNCKLIKVPSPSIYSLHRQRPKERVDHLKKVSKSV